MAIDGARVAASPGSSGVRPDAAGASLGEVTSVRGEARIVAADGAIAAAAPGEGLFAHDVVITGDGGQVEIRLAGGPALVVGGGGQCILTPATDATDQRAPTLHVIAGGIRIAAGATDPGPVVVETAAGRLTLLQGGLVLQASAPDAIRFALLAAAAGAAGRIEIVNAAGAFTIAAPGDVVIVEGGDGLPRLAGEIGGCDRLLAGFADTAPADAVCAPAAAERAADAAVVAEPLAPLAASDGAVEVSAGGDPSAAAGDAFRVTLATTPAFDLAPQSAPLADPAVAAAASSEPPTAAGRHTAEALFQNAVPPPEVVLPDPSILRDWDPGRRWQALGQADEFAGQIPELPLEATRLVSSRQGEMVMLEASNVSRLQIEGFLGLGQGTLAELVPGTSPGSGAAIKALDTIGLRAGETIRFDVFFDAAGTAVLNDFAVFSVAVGGQTLALPIVSIADVGDFGASGWRTISYTAGVGGRYTFGFAVLDDGPALASSRLFVDHVRREETSGFPFVTLESVGDSLGGTYRLLAPAPIAADDALTVGEDGILAAQPVALLLANDRDPDPFDPLTVSGLDRTGTRGRLAIGGNQTFTYDPAGRFDGLAAGETATDRFTYILDGGNGMTARGTVSVRIIGANDAPVAIADAARAAEGGPPVVINVTANDLDVDSDDDGASLRVVAAAAQSGATVRFTSAPGAPITYVPPASGDLTSDVITYTITDRHGALASGIVTVQIAPRNDAPRAGDDVAAVHEDGAIRIDVLANDRDPDGAGTMVISALDLTGARGAVAIEANALHYTAAGRFESLAEGEIAFDRFRYAARDDAGAEGTSAVTVTITGRNDAPIARPDQASARERGEPVTIDVLANDDDVDGDDGPATLRVIAASAASGTEVRVSGTPGAGIVYAPDPGRAWPNLAAGAAAEDVITYTIEDRWGARAEGTAVVAIQGVNDPVTAYDDAVTVAEDGATIFAAPGLLANDWDPDGPEGLRLARIEGVELAGPLTLPLPSGALLTANPDGAVSYDPNRAFEALAVGQTARDAFTYTVSDGFTTDTARVSVTIIGANDAPIANPDFARVGEDGPDIAIDVLANDDDVDADDAAASLRVVAAGAASGVPVLFSGRPGEGVRYAPGAAFQSLAGGELGIDTVTYSIVDRHGATATGTVTITVEGVNDRPVAGADRYNINADARLDIPATLGLLANDRDADAGDRLAVTAVNGATAAIGATIALPSGALLAVAADGRFVYDPNGRFAGLDPFGAASDGFTYTVADASGAAAVAAVEIRIFKDNQPPVAADDQATTDADRAIRIPVLLNDVDPERALLRIAGIDAGETRGRVRINDDGSVTYDPNDAFRGLAPGETATDRFRYTVDDNIGGRDEALVTVTVRGVAAAGGASEQLLQSFETPFGLFVAGWAREPGETAVDSPVRLVGAHVAAGAAFGPTHFAQMALIEARGSSARGPGIAQSAVEAFLDLPGGALPDDDGRHAGETGDGTEPDTAAAVRTALSIGAGDRDAAGRVTLGFDWNFLSAETVADNLPGRNDYAVLTITDGALARVITLGDARTVGMGASGWRTSTFDLSAAFPQAASEPLRLTIGFAVVNDESSASPSALLLDNVRLNPRLADGLELIGGNAGDALQTWRAPPIARDDASAAGLVTDEDGVLRILPVRLLDNDGPSPGAARASLAIVAIDGTGTRGRVMLDLSGLVYDPSGRFDALGDGEQATDSFAYTIRDANGGQATARVAITVTGHNDAPLAEADAVAFVDGAGAVPIDVLGNDRDPDDGVRALRLVAASATSGANVRFSGEPGAGLVYDPGDRFRALSAGETAIDTISYRVADPRGATASGLVTVTITGTNAPPVAVDDALRIDQNTVATLALTANDRDEDRADRLAITAIEGQSVAQGGTIRLPSGAQATLIDTGSVRYDPGRAFIALRPGEELTDVFRYRIDDGHGGSDEARAAVTVFGLNDAPIASLDRVSTTADRSLFLSPATLLANDFDPDRGDVVRLIGVDPGGAVGSVSYDGGRIVFDPTGRFAALGQGETSTDTFGYRIADGEGFTGQGSVEVTVIGINDPPRAVADVARTDEDHPVRIDVLANDQDPDTGDRLTVTGLDVRGTLGTVSLASDGTISYDPAGRFDALNATESATDSFRYTVTDGFGRSDSATVTVTITGRNDVERLVESFEQPLAPAQRTSSFATTVAGYQEPDGEKGSYQPTDGAMMARLEARGSPASELERFLGLAPGSLPKDIDGSSPAFGSAIKLKTGVAAGDEVSFDWMFDARDAVNAPADGFADNDYAVVVINDGAGARLFKLADIRAVGDRGASGWQTSVFEAPAAGELVIGFGVINDRSAEPIAENSFLLVDNLRINRDLDEGYRSVTSEHEGGLATLAQQTS